jgi:hypothetical protein
MSWTKNINLITKQETMPSKDLFQAVCDEIGEYYGNKGFKYSRTRPKIVYKDKVLKVEICFWSSRYNTSGKSVTLEILPNFYSLEVIKKGLSKSASKIANGFILGHTDLLITKSENSDNKIIKKQIFGDIHEKDVEGKLEPTISNHHICDIYGINEEKFNKIIGFIDEKIIPWIDKIQTADGIVDFIENRPKSVHSNLLGEAVNSDFIPYCNLRFPELNIEKRLKE